MRLASFDAYELDASRMVELSLGVAGACGVTIYLASGSVLGADGPLLSVILSAVVFYLVMTTPRRLLQMESLVQSRQAPLLASSCASNFEASHSRAKALLLLPHVGGRLEHILTEAKKQVLLGRSVPDSLEFVRTRATSRSVRTLLVSLARTDPRSLEEKGDESRGLFREFRLSEETKVPLFMAVSFFSPIMLTLLAVLARFADPREYAGLATLEVAVLDICFYYSLSERIAD
ncbi:MAG TPA: hypothetical protein VEJ36_05135 [Nitrososphaerales archaeon]|nr:hypothetical protein [Nitrososphaerales archaeon]